VEPQSSGIGGGGFMLYYDAETKAVQVFDGRETAPANMPSSAFLNADGNPRPFFDALPGGLSVGTPGLLRMLEMAHNRHGSKPWKSLFSDAITLSGEGFPMSPRLHHLLESISEHMQQFPDSIRPFTDANGKWLDVGKKVVNKPLSLTLGSIAEAGVKPFYEGEIAQDMVHAVRQAKPNPGYLSLDDLKHYRAIERKPVCAPYRQYTVCSMPPPSSGGVTILQALGILEHLPVDIATLEPLSADAVHLFAEASKLAYADRNRYLADPAFEAVPVAQMLDNTYLASRARLVSEHYAMDKALPGVFGQNHAQAPFQEEHPSTTHISVVDGEGNAVSMTTSIEYGFGSGLSADGFLLNNQLTDFSFSPTLSDGQTPHPNRVEGGKRPRSSMSPTIVLDKNRNLVAAIGSPGGARIIEYTLQSLVGILAWNMDVQAAINLPHYLNMNGPTELEAGTSLEGIAEALETRGHAVKVMDTPSGLHGIVKTATGLAGGADPRREGVALGE
ncbi:MAG: gamma-glutamyltransferase, partial [Rickettsiales bacterium]